MMVLPRRLKQDLKGLTQVDLTGDRVQVSQARVWSSQESLSMVIHGVEQHLKA